MPGESPGRRGERGTAFFAVTFLALIATGLIGAYLSSSLGKVRHVEREVSRTSAFHAAESGLNAAIEAAWRLYRSEAPSRRVESMVALAGGGASPPFGVPERRLGRSLFAAIVRNVNVVSVDYADVEFEARGWNEHASRTLRAVVRFGHRPAEVFDHGYFINNYGWLWGAGITVNGSVRSNGNVSVRNATVNGDILASENPALSAEGRIDGDLRFKDLDWYTAQAGLRARPTSPTAVPEDANRDGVLDAGEDRNGNGRLDDFLLADGYDAAPERRERLPALEMPYLGDLSGVRSLAIERHGTIAQGGRLIVDGVLGDDPAEDRNLLLVGTVDDPIVVNGPVVIENDVVLRGVIRGQGTIYAGRNVHLIGDLVYQDPPEWPKPAIDMEAVKAQNAARDMVGLAARGSIVIGDYTTQGWQSVTRGYQKPPFTQPYEVDASDGDIGYVSYWEEGRPMFDGDYTDLDGGRRAADPDQGHPERDPGTVPRRYFESSFSDARIHSLAEEQVRRVDGVLYTNHLLTGKVGACEFNGTLVSRDEAMIYNGSLTINYDIRVRQGAYEFLETYLPREPMRRVLFWSDGS